MWKSSTDEQLAAIQEEMTSCETAMSELTNEMALPFIDAVYLYPDRRVEIKWKFKDMFL